MTLCNGLKVNDLRGVKNVHFSSLPSGQLFEHDGAIYMKLRFLYKESTNETSYNCIIIAHTSNGDKKTGYYRNFNPEDIITLSKLTLVIE